MLCHWVNSSWDYLTLKIQTLWSCKTLGAIYPVTQYNIPPGLNLHTWITSFLENLQREWKRIHSAHFDQIQLILNSPQLFRWVTYIGFSIRHVLKIVAYWQLWSTIWEMWWDTIHTLQTTKIIQTNKLDSHLNIVTSLKVHCSLRAIRSVSKRWL
jgi:hypothetical protein